MYMFKLVPKEDRKDLERIGKAFLVLIAVATILLMITNCAYDGLGPAKVNNSNFNVVYLFTVDGCKVHRFFDTGDYHYVTTCEGSVEQAVSCGKSCTCLQKNQTVKPKSCQVPK